MAQHYRELVAWQKAMQLVTAIYRVSAKFLKEELYGLTNQLRRSAVSIPSNIAEGQGRGTGVDFCRFLRIARGSRQEMETQLLVAQELGYASVTQIEQTLELSAEVGRVLSGLSKSIERTSN